MLQANTYNTTGVEVNANSPVTFENVTVETGCTATCTPGSTTIYLNRPGYYMVQFNGYGNIETAATNGTLEISMYNNGTEVPYANALAASTSPADIENIQFSTIVRVLPSCPSIDNDAALTFVNTGAEATYYNINVTVTKLC
jgi:hypothetical protein